MNNFKLNKNNNSKKLYIGVSILFCAVILIIGGTLAYFTQSDSETIDNIATVDKVELEYIDDFDENKNYMRQELIPASIDNVIKAYTREDTQNKCLDSRGSSACSVYRFSIKNTSDISQKLQMTLNPTANTFTNLKFLLYEITKEKNNQLMNTTDLIKDSLTAISLYESYTLKPNEIKTFELVFYVENQTYDQTSEDAGKVFGAGIRVDSITTGTYIAKNFGESCWNYEDSTLMVFNGISSDGEPKDECSGYVEKDTNGFYTINVPSNVGGQEITTLGNTLFLPVDMQTLEYTPLSKVKQYNIEEGITTIADGYDVTLSGNQIYIGTFTSAGYDYFKQQDFVDGGVQINLPNTLRKIGKNAFSFSNLKDIVIPPNMEKIGEFSFAKMKGKTVKIQGVKNANDKAFLVSNFDTLIISGDIPYYETYFYFCLFNKLILEEGITTLGSWFSNMDIVTDKNNPLIIPKSVQTIKKNAFSMNPNINALVFAGAEDGTSNLKTIEEKAFYHIGIEELVLPASVTKIDSQAFGKDVETTIKLSSLKFINTDENPSQLTTIGENAFSSNNISTLTIPNSVTSIGDNAFESNNISTLTIPNSVTSIGDNAFSSNKNLIKLTFEEGSKLTSIGKWAFSNCNLTYTDSKNPLIIPSSVTSIGSWAFESYSFETDDNPQNRNLKFIRFEGTLLEGNSTYWYDSSNTKLNPPIEE